MSAHGNSPGHGSVRFERSDVAARPVVVAVAVLVGFTFVFTGIAWVVFQALAAREAANSPPMSPLAAQYAATQPPEPRLQVDPKADLLALRAMEAKELHKLAWVDKGAGIVQVPIERAMELVVAKGLPARQAAVPRKMVPQTGTAPDQFTEGSGAPDWQGSSTGSAAAGGHAPAAHAPAAPEAHGH